ncbi:MAG: OmpA family protein [Bacteroidota bacterium]
MKNRILALFLILSTTIVLAQNPTYTTTTNDKAIKQMEKALQFFDLRKDDEAIKAVNKALELDPNFAEAVKFLGDIYYDHKETAKALEQYKKALKINPKFNSSLYLQIGIVEFEQANYPEAKAFLAEFVKLPGTSSKNKSIGEQMLKSAIFAEEAIKHPVPFNPINLGNGVNTFHYEYFPATTVDDKTLLFTRNLRDEKSGQMQQEDFYISYFTNGAWSLARPIIDINTEVNEGAPSLSADGQYLFYSGCDRPSGFGSCDIYLSKKTGDKWGKPKNIGAPVNTKHWDTQPSFSSDGKTLYFVSNRPGGYGGSDIWVSSVTEKGWGLPVNLGPTINTAGSEQSPYIHPDTKTLYFSSDGHPGMGSSDLFVSTMDKNGNFPVPKNMGYPINTNNEESSIIVSGSGKYGYISVEKDGAQGGLDLFAFELTEENKPQIISYMKGKVYDKETKQPLEAKFELINLETQILAVTSTSNSGNGEFLVSLPTNNYALNVSKSGYLFYSENFSLKENKDNKPYIKDVPLTPIKVGEKVVLKNVFFETAKFDLKQESKIELNKLVAFLEANPNLKIELSGHTDNVGDKKYNQTLSQNRAKAVYDYLIANKVVATRLTFVGYGDTQPLAKNDTEEGKAQNRRTEFKVTAN